MEYFYVLLTIMAMVPELPSGCSENVERTGGRAQI